ncbi:MAG TPA: ABC transporter substrate-binding protein, partial [Acidimicrobiia bacterium]|nr:ABC transporter substrate-binding protein [Acidimicrobiia bacterium]
MKHLWQRRSLAWLGLLLAFALVVAACGDDTTASTTTEGSTTTTAATTTTQGTTTTTAPPGKPYGGEVIIGADQEPPTLNTYLPGGNNFIVSIVGQTYWMGVQDIDGYTLELVPDVVTELPSVDNGGIAVNADGTETIKYSIRDEAVWADGTPISGDDFAFTYDTIMNPDYPITTTIYEDILPDSVVAGPKTFEFTLSAPTVQAEFLFGVLLPKHDVEGKDFLNDYNDSMWMSGGPFEFEQWNKGDFLSVTRNPNFWKTDAETGQQLPFLDRVIFRFIPETASLINAFKAREVDAINPPPSIATIEDLQTLEPEGATIEVLSGPIWEHMWFTMGTNNRNAGSYNSHLNFRKAVAHALNKQQIVDDILAGQVEPMDSYVDAFAPTLSQGSWAQYDYNPETAIQYIADLCAEDGVDCVANPPKAIFSTTSNNDARAKLAELFAEYLPAVGILYEAQLEDSSLFFGETLDFGTADLGEFAWVG